MDREKGRAKKKHPKPPLSVEEAAQEVAELGEMDRELEEAVEVGVDLVEEKERDLTALECRFEELSQRCRELEGRNAKAHQCEEDLLKLSEQYQCRIHEAQCQLGAQAAELSALRQAAELMHSDIARHKALFEMAEKELSDLKGKTAQAQTDLAQEREKLAGLLASRAKLQPFAEAIAELAPSGPSTGASPKLVVGTASVPAAPFVLRGQIEDYPGEPSSEPFEVYSAKTGQLLGRGRPDAGGWVDMTAPERDLYIVLASTPDQKYRVEATPA